MAGRIIIISFVTFLVFSCYHENQLEAEAPPSRLNEEQFVDLLTDIQLAEAISAYNRLQRQRTDQQYNDSLFAVIFRHHGLSAEEVKENISYYNSFPETMERIHEKVLSNLSKRQGEVEEMARKAIESGE